MPVEEASLASEPGVVVVGCAALAREIRSWAAGRAGVEVVLLPAPLHNRPGRIPAAVAGALDDPARAGRRAIVAYGDCGTGGRLDEELEERGVGRLDGAHCYEVVAGRERFAGVAEEEPGTFYLTEFLARHFESLVIAGLGIDRHPELASEYFAHYRRVVLLARHPGSDPGGAEVRVLGRRAAELLGLEFEVVEVGDEPFHAQMDSLAGAV